MRWSLLKITPLAILWSTIEISGQSREPCSILRVIDAGQVELLSGECVDLIGLQPFANRSSASAQFEYWLDSLLIGRPLEIEYDSDRRVAGAYLWRDSLLINCELLRLGLAQVWDDTLALKLKEKFLAAEQEAKAARRGNWRFAAPESTTSAATWITGNDTVFVSKAGKKYHQAGCRFLSQSRIALPLSKARLEYSACRLCMPASNADKFLLQPGNRVPATAARCMGITQKGKPCMRAAQPGSKYCWQHRPD
jgi:hypothetical protein